MSYGAKGGHSYGNQKRGSSGKHGRKNTERSAEAFRQWVYSQNPDARKLADPHVVAQKAELGHYEGLENNKIDYDHEIVNGMKPMTLRQGAPDIERGAFIRNQIVAEYLNGKWSQSEEMYRRELAVAQRYMEDHYTDPFFVGTQVYEWDWKEKAWKKAKSGKYEDSRLGW